MAHLFTHGTRGEPTKQTPTGEMPVSWDIKTLGELSQVMSGGTPSRTEPAYWGGDIPWVKTGEIDYGTIATTEETITQEGLQNSSARIIPAGTLLMAMYGQGITRGRVAILGIDAAINQACAAIFCSQADLLTDFAFHFLAYSYESIRNLGHGANQKNLNAMLVRSIPISLPPTVEEQRRSSGSSVCLRRQSRRAGTGECAAGRAVPRAAGGVDDGAGVGGGDGGLQWLTRNISAFSGKVLTPGIDGAKSSPTSDQISASGPHARRTWRLARPHPGGPQRADLSEADLARRTSVEQTSARRT